MNRTDKRALWTLAVCFTPIVMFAIGVGVTTGDWGALIAVSLIVGFPGLIGAVWWLSGKVLKD